MRAEDSEAKKGTARKGERESERERKTKRDEGGGGRMGEE